MTPRRLDILGAPVDCVAMQDAVAYVDELLVPGGKVPATIIAVNPEKVIAAQRDAFLMQRLHAATLLVPDGIGVVWAARMLHGQRLQRVAGADLMVELCARAAISRRRVFLLGASPEVNERAAAELVRRFPGLCIAGRQHGFVQESEMGSVVGAINESAAELLFIALGSPRQELWMARHLPELSVKVCQGVGGTFDVIAGAVKRAPVAWRAAHLEWAYRLLSDPRRLARQRALPSFAWQVLKAAVFNAR